MTHCVRVCVFESTVGHSSPRTVKETYAVQKLTVGSPDAICMQIWCRISPAATVELFTLSI